MYRSERLELRLTNKDLEVLDKIRGPVSRSAWLRNQIHQAGAHFSTEDHFAFSTEDDER